MRYILYIILVSIVSSIVFFAGLAMFSGSDVVYVLNSGLFVMVLAYYILPIFLFVILAISFRKIIHPVPATMILIIIAIILLMVSLLFFQPSSNGIHVATLSSIAITIVCCIDILYWRETP